MAYHYRLFPEAQSDLDHALSWYGEQGGQRLKQRFFVAYVEARKKICKNPGAYPFAFEYFRKARLKKFPFKIIYALDQDDVIIIAVMHDKRHPDYWKERIL